MFTTIETPENTYYGEPSSNESKYYGKVYYKNGWSYQGYLMNGKKHGYGEMKTIDGNYTKGYYSNDLLNGKAIMYIKEKGTYIDGYYINGKLNGECLFYDDKGKLINRGMYKDDKSCVATYETIYANINNVRSKVYEGYVYEEKYNGFGKLYEDDKVYIGNFTSGKKDGKFIVCYTNGNLVYTPQVNIDTVIDIEKVTKDNFSNYKNTIIYNNNMYDDSHKIVYKDMNGFVQYIGKLNMDMKYDDDKGTFYPNTNNVNIIYSGKFKEGKFLSGAYNFNGGSCKGEFNNFMLNGSGTIKFDGNYRFICDKFIDNVSEYSNLEWGNNFATKIRCQISIVNDKSIFNTLPETEYQLDEVNKYVGDIKLSKTTLEPLKITLTNGKHFTNNVLVYEGEFKNWEYFGSGIKYHPNGNLNITGTFQNGDAIKAEYYDETGNLIYSDVDEYNDMPGLEAPAEPALEPLFQLPPVPQLSNPPPIFSAMISNVLQGHSGVSLNNSAIVIPELIQNLVNSLNNLGNSHISNQNNLNVIGSTIIPPPDLDDNDETDFDGEHHDHDD